MSRFIIRGSIFAALILSILPCVTADDLGLLLTTPEERLLIQQWRNHEETPVTIHPPAPEQQTITLSGVHYNGMVINSRGKTSYWVNGRQVETPEEAEQLGVSFTPDLRQGLQINAVSDREEPVFIQPGETHSRQQLQPPVALPFTLNTEAGKTPARIGSDNKD